DCVINRRRQYISYIHDSTYSSQIVTITREKNTLSYTTLFRSPGALLELAVEIGAAGVLLDTMAKDAGLFMLLDPTTVGEWVAAAHAADRLAGLAGSLRGTDFATARALGADLVGVRGAACVGGRTGRVSRGRVAALSALARAAPPLAVTALV